MSNFDFDDMRRQLYARLGAAGNDVTRGGDPGIAATLLGRYAANQQAAPPPGPADGLPPLLQAAARQAVGMDAGGAVPMAGQGMGPAVAAAPVSPFSAEYLQEVNKRLEQSTADSNGAQIRAAAGQIPLVNGRMVAGGNYTVNSTDRRYPTDPSFEPITAAALTAAIKEMNAKGLVPQINKGFRSAAEQQYIRDHPGKNPVAQGPSWHQAGRAVDINPGGVDFDTVRAIMQAHGFTWGGRFNRVDPPHFQYAPPRTNPTPSVMDDVGGN